MTDPGSTAPSGGDTRGAADPALFGIDAADVGKEPTLAESKLIENYSKIIENSFIWYAVEAQTKLEALRRDLKKVDPPHWSQQVASFVLESALAAGAQASGLALAGKLVSGEATREFLQNLFASGVTGGIAAGQAKLAGGNDDTVVDTFVDSQREGVTKRQQGSQSEFILNGRQQLKSVAQAQDLAAACDNGNAKAAAAHQYAASRDAWVSYLAQQKFGAESSRFGPLPTTGTRASWVDVGDVTTNMSNKSWRDRDRAHRGGHLIVPENAPDFDDAVLGDCPGVLTVVVDLPAISRNYDVIYGGFPQPTAAFEMHGAPSVALATLNGVNAAVRRQYAGPLAASHIPRLVIARVSGGADFTLNLNEKGRLAHRPADIKWLAARAVVEKPARSKFDDDTNHVRGIQLLLNEVVPTDIVDKVL